MLYYVFEEGSGRRRRTKKLTFFNGFSRGNSFIKQIFSRLRRATAQGGGGQSPNTSPPKSMIFHLRYKVAGIPRKNNLAKPVARKPRTRNLIPPPLFQKSVKTKV